jgi:O-antigen/teichoic acid export membrane protein
MNLGEMAAAEAAASRFGIKRLYRDAASIAFSNVANAVLGVAFWAVAARIVAPESLGVMTAVLAVIVSVGVVVASGVGDAYSALLPAVGAARPDLYRRGQRLFLVLAAVGGGGGAVGTIMLLAEVRGSIAVGVMVAIGILGWSAVTLQNSVLVALGRAKWLPATNISTSAAKIALLPLLAATVAWHVVELSFVISAVAIVVVLRPIILRVIDSDKDLPQATMPENLAVRTFSKFVPQTMAASALSFGTITLTPFLVTAFAGPRQGALFALALSMVQALDYVCAALAASLIVHAASAPEHGATMARAILIRTLLVATVGSVAIVVLAPVALETLNSEYGAMGAKHVIAALCVGAIIRSVFMVWASLQKARRKLKMPLAINAVAASILLAIMPHLCANYGAMGGALALLLAQSVLSAGAAAHVLISYRRGGLANRNGSAQAA